MPPHPLVNAIAQALNAPARARDNIAAGSPEALAVATNLPEQVIFAGYNGAVYRRPADQVQWQVLYIDPRLHRWMIVEATRVRNSQLVSDHRSPTGDYDYVWVDTDALVGSGSRSQSVETPFLTGEFVRAGDFEAPPSGAATSSPTGAYCVDVRTPECLCYRTRTRC
jgi:hypothetical protein